MSHSERDLDLRRSRVQSMQHAFEADGPGKRTQVEQSYDAPPILPKLDPLQRQAQPERQPGRCDGVRHSARS